MLGLNKSNRRGNPQYVTSPTQQQGQSGLHLASSSQRTDPIIALVALQREANTSSFAMVQPRSDPVPTQFPRVQS